MGGRRQEGHMRSRLTNIIQRRVGQCKELNGKGRGRANGKQMASRRWERCTGGKLADVIQRRWVGAKNQTGRAGMERMGNKQEAGGEKGAWEAS